MSEENTNPEQEPVEIPADAATGTPESAPEEKPAKKPGWEKRIDVLTARLRETERENERLKQAAPTPAPQDDSKKPSIDDFDSDEAYLAAVAEYSSRRVLSEAEEKARAQRDREAQEASDAEVSSNVQKMFARGADAHADYEAVVMSPTLSLTNEMLAAIASTDNGHDISYHLGKNPGEADAISELSPVQQAIAIGRLGERLNTTQRAVSSAPPPVTTVDDTSAGTTDGLSDNLDVKTWMQRRQAQRTA